MSRPFAAISAWFLRVVGTLDGYVLRRFLLIYVANLVSFSLIFVLLDLFEHLDEFIVDDQTAGELLHVMTRYYGAILPMVYCHLLGPIVTLTAGLFTVTLFQRANELVPMLANGRSYRRLFAPMLVAAIVIAFGTSLIQEFWIPGTRKTFLEVVGQRDGDRVLVDRKYRDETTGDLIIVKRYHPGERRAEGVTVLPGGRSSSTSPQRLIEARSMRWVQPELEPDAGHWLLEDGWMQTYAPQLGLGYSRLVPVPQSTGPPQLGDPFAEERLTTTMIPQDLEIHEEQVVHMTLSQLRRKMDGSSVDRVWAIKFYSRFTDPLGSVILLLLGFPVICFFGTRNIFIGALLAACIGGGYFVSVAFFQEIAVRGFLSGPVGAAFGPLLYLALGITALRYMRT